MFPGGPGEHDVSIMPATMAEQLKTADRNHPLDLNTLFTNINKVIVEKDKKYGNHLPRCEETLLNPVLPQAPKL